LEDGHSNLSSNTVEPNDLIFFQKQLNPDVAVDFMSSPNLQNRLSRFSSLLILDETADLRNGLKS
jgi:hypothetical protein